MRWTVLRRFALSPTAIAALVVACVTFSIADPCGARTRPHYGGTLRVELEGDPMQRDLLQRPDGIGWRLMLDGLTELDNEGVLRPSLAQRWASDNNNQRWQFW